MVTRGGAVPIGQARRHCCVTRGQMTSEIASAPIPRVVCGMRRRQWWGAGLNVWVASLKRSKDEIVYDTVYERNERFVGKRHAPAHLTHEASRCNHTITCWSLSRRRRDMYSDHGRLCACLSLTAFPHYCTDPDVTCGMVGVPPSCALLGGFAIGAITA